MNHSFHNTTPCRRPIFFGLFAPSGPLQIVLPLAVSIFLALFLSSCATRGITLRVRDRHTGQPIRDAAVLAWWDTTVYIAGVPGKKPCLIVEGSTDEQGTMTILPDEKNLYRTPHIKIYKPNYVGWSDRWVYLGPVGDFQTINDQVRTHDPVTGDRVIYLEPWHAEYDRESHLAFLTQNLPCMADPVAQDSLDYLKILESNEHIAALPFAVHSSMYRHHE